jgi:hypothetical protein
LEFRWDSEASSLLYAKKRWNVNDLLAREKRTANRKIIKLAVVTRRALNEPRFPLNWRAGGRESVRI